mmetsp:Transcript_27946/g.64730  ORF Transcript_27946/g.64730 Transcript_27946/m.64730 type:complete len:103 (+) Transcript_27946:294-602(+)
MVPDNWLFCGGDEADGGESSVCSSEMGAGCYSFLTVWPIQFDADGCWGHSKFPGAFLACGFLDSQERPLSKTIPELADWKSTNMVSTYCPDNVRCIQLAGSG